MLKNEKEYKRCVWMVSKKAEIVWILGQVNLHIGRFVRAGVLRGSLVVWCIMV